MTAQLLRFFALFFIALLGPACRGNVAVAVATADRPSPVLARAGRLGMLCAGCQGSRTARLDVRRTQTSNHRYEGHS